MTRVSLFFIGLSLVLGLVFVANITTSPNTSASPGTGILFGTDAGAGMLLQVNTGTGVGTVVGPMGFNAPALAKDPITGKLYAGSGSLADNLYEINPADGSATLKGASGLGTQSYYGGMDFDSAGVLYASMSLAGGGNTGSDYLVTVNTSNGVATVVGPFGICTGNSIPHNVADGSCTLEGMEAIAFDAAGNLWAAENVRGAFGAAGLYSVNKITGAATFSDPITDGSGHPSGGVVTLQFACDGTLYGGSARRTGGNTDGGFLGTINVGTGAWAPVGVVAATSGDPANSLGGLAFDTNPCPTPTPSPTPTPTPTTGPFTQTPAGGTPVAVGGILGLTDEQPGSGSGTSQAILALGVAGLMAAAASGWALTRRSARRL